ncbi:hypothetical protein JHK85_039531 [Glycine max]|nr:hypothetical protein JHK85_039531 [Glycine max]
MEDDKALQLCRERKKFVRQALDGRCSLAAAHVSYIQSLKNTGTALRKFTEPEGPIEPSLYTTATPEQPLALTERTLSFSSASVSHHIDAAEHENFSPTPSLPSSSSKFRANHMKHSTISSKKVEEKPPVPVIGIVTSSGTTTQNTSVMSGTAAFEDSSLPAGTPQWDFFGLFHPIDHQFSFQDGKGMHQDIGNADDIQRLREEEGIPELEDDEEKASSHGREHSRDSEDEFDEEPAAETLVQRFENLNRSNSHVQANFEPATTKPLRGHSASEVELVNGEKGNSAYLSPLKTAPMPALPPPETNKPMEKESHGSLVSSFLKVCFSCGEDPSQVPEEPAQNSVKYLTWHRTASSRSSSSRNPLGANSIDNAEDHANNLFDNSCMISGSHASTLDRLYAWERKLYDEVKASEIVRKEYDMKCKFLRQLESKGEKTSTVDKTRAKVKDLHSRIIVSIHRINSISKRIAELRDKELQPQLEELIEGLNRMWEVMHECHKLQFQIMSAAYNNSHARITMHSELRRQITSYLENELQFLSSSFTKWIGAQKCYLEAINGWLHKCVRHEEKSSKRKRRLQSDLSFYDPPIYVTCALWLDKLSALPVKDVADSIKSLATDTAQFLPHQDKNQGKGAHPHMSTWKADIGGESADGLLRDDISEDWVAGLDQFRRSLIRFLSQLNNLSGCSVKMYTELRQAIQKVKNYQRLNSQSQNGHLNSQSQDGHPNSESQS